MVIRENRGMTANAAGKSWCCLATAVGADLRSGGWTGASRAKVPLANLE
jgi:hypothetical protein